MSKEIRNSIFNLPEVGSSGSSWTPKKLGTKVLFWGMVSEISGGQIPNKVTGSSDYLTITGNPATYQVPNTAPYIAADTDYVWFRLNTTQRTTTTAELIGYDFSRTIVKYDNATPYALREIIILKVGEVLTTDEENSLRDYMDLSVWWDGILNLHGNIKGNRGSSKSETLGVELIPANSVWAANGGAWWNGGFDFLIGNGVKLAANGNINAIKYNFWTIGKTYRLVTDAIVTSGSLSSMFDGVGGNHSITISGQDIGFYTVGGTAHLFLNGTAFVGEITGLSVREQLLT